MECNTALRYSRISSSERGVLCFWPILEQEVMCENGAEFGDDGVPLTFGNDDAALSAASTGVAVRRLIVCIEYACVVPRPRFPVSSAKVTIRGMLSSFFFSSSCSDVLQ